MQNQGVLNFSKFLGHQIEAYFLLNPNNPAHRAQDSDAANTRMLKHLEKGGFLLKGAQKIAYPGGCARKCL